MAHVLFNRKKLISLLLLLALLAWIYTSYNLESVGPDKSSVLLKIVEPEKKHIIIVPNNQSSTQHQCTPNCRSTYTERLNRYCHTSILDKTERFSSTNEGVLKADGEQYELVHLHIVARHGDRTPVSKLRLGPKVYYECGLDDSTFNWNGLDDFPPPIPHLISPRAFGHDFHLNPGAKRRDCADVRGAGVLTALGYKQHAALGRLMQERYRDFVSTIINNAESLRRDVFVQSTDVLRTIHSLSAFMLGFLPDSPKLRQATVIQVSRGTLLASPPPGVEMVYNHCHDYRQLLEEDRRQTGYTTAVNNKRYLISNLCKMFGLLSKCQSLSVAEVFEHLMIRGCHQSLDSLPCNGGLCVNYSQALELFELVDWSWSKKHPLKSSIIAMAPFVKHSVLIPMERIISSYQDASTDPGLFRVVISLTHDDTITKLLASLGVPLTEWMPYASRLVFELWKKKGRNSSEDFELRMLFNGELVTKQCGAWREEMSEELVPFPIFSEFLTTGLYRDVDSYNRVCHI